MQSYSLVCHRPFLIKELDTIHVFVHHAFEFFERNLVYVVIHERYLVVFISINFSHNCSDCGLVAKAAKNVFQFLDRYLSIFILIIEREGLLEFLLVEYSLELQIGYQEFYICYPTLKVPL